jgi:hypothetical protein
VTNDEAVTGYKFLFAIIGTFGRYVTNLRGTFVENAKKSIINPPYCAWHVEFKQNFEGFHPLLTSKLDEKLFYNTVLTFVWNFKMRCVLKHEPKSPEPEPPDPQ